MKNVLIDNWFLENIAFKYNDQLQLFSSQEFLNILEAILLWDNVYYPENEYSHFWQYLIGVVVVHLSAAVQTAEMDP